MKWPIKPLGKVADLCLGKMLDQKKNKGDLLPYLANVNVRWGTFDVTDLRQMKFEAHELDRYGIKYGDIVMCEGGEPGRCAIWKEQVQGMMIQKALHRIRPHDCLNHIFLYYQLLYRGKNGEFSKLFTGATIKHLPGQNLAKLEIAIPPSQLQQKIASILSAYDDLIENNRRRIQLLEESARQLYKEWFVRLRFPGHEHVKVVDGVPEGWERKTIKDVSGFVSRGIAPSYDEAAKYLVLNQKCIRNHFVDFEFARRQKKEVSQNKVLQYGDVLINSTGTGTLGRVAQYFGEIKNCTIDSHVTIARPSDASFITYYGYAILDNEDYLSRMGRGSTNQTELSKFVIEDIPFLKPTFILIKRFELAVIETKKQIQTLATQNHKLAQARDLLLPKLMNGEVAV